MNLYTQEQIVITNTTTTVLSMENFLDPWLKQVAHHMLSPLNDIHKDDTYLTY
jgi:hypothetical protein